MLGPSLPRLGFEQGEEEKYRMTATRVANVCSCSLAPDGGESVMWRFIPLHAHVCRMRLLQSFMSETLHTSVQHLSTAVASYRLSTGDDGSTPEHTALVARIRREQEAHAAWLARVDQWWARTHPVRSSLFLRSPSPCLPSRPEFA